MPERVDRFPVDQRDLRWVPEGAVGACPASRLQTGVLYHNVKGDAHVYHDVLSCTVEHAPGTGCLDETAFRSALTSLVAAHPVLRTGFVVEGAGSPLHVLHPEAEIDCAFFDVRDEGPVAVERWVTAERAAPFDITVPGLLRVAVHRTGERRSVVSLSYHHALLDTRSAAALAAELLSRATGSEPAVRTEVDASPAHLALERAAERSADQRAYWADVLEGIEPTEIPLPGRPPGRPTTAEAEASVPVPPELSEGIRALAARTGVTSRSVHAAAHLALLSYVSGEPDVVTGLVADLPPETGELGFFVNILPCRLDVGRRAWQDLIQAVADAEEAARPHSRYPFALIEADAGARFCATEFAHTELPDMDPPPATGVRVTGVHLHERTDYFHLLVSVLEQPSTGRTRVTLHYPPALISSEQAEHYAELYGRLLRHAVGAPDEPAVDALGHWSEQQGLTARAATGETTRGGGTPVLAEIVRRLRSAPDTDIVQEYAGRRETAHGLAVRVSRARRALLAADAGPGRRVACFLERGADPLVALLAVWSVGASYVPIDPALPPDRQRALLALVGCAAALRSPGVPPDARVWEGPEAVLTTAPATAARVGPGPDDRPIGADGPASVPDGQNGHDDWTAELGSWTVPAPDSEAYVLFTSGSTGRPKAVSMPHRGVANLVSWQLAEPEFARPRRVSQFAALSFDVSVQEMACAAASGSTLVVIPDAVRRNPEELLGFLGHELIEVAFLPVAAVHQLTVAWEAFGITPGRLRYVVTAGEALVVTGSVRGFCQAVGAELINQYGPTETHVTLCHRLGPDPAAWPHRPPIGHAIHNTTLRILDPLGRPVPRGTPGELHIGGASVADGYADAGGTDPLTAERFTHDAAGGGRSYRTGDIVRVREEDGAVVFVGRADEQTKIRGHRVEPAEVATVLLRHPGVRHCAVRALPVGGAGLDLVAFVEPSAPGLTAEQLREHLREALPEYAVPAHVEILDRLPLTRSGKIDSRALRITARPAHEAATAAPHPVGAVEAQVLRVWEEVLGRPVTSPRLTFFAAGGNSLLLMRLYLGLRTAFGIEFPLHELFRHTTAAAFAEFVRERETATGAEAGAGTGPEAEAGTGPGTGAARGRGGHGPTHEDADVTAVHRTQDGTRPMDIAVVGMSCRFPGAPDVDAFWRLIREGTDNVTFFSEEELRGARVPGPLLADPDYVRAGRPLEHPGAFDAAFFGISPREAELTDPQARLFLELCWLALEDAGHDPARYPGQIGVFATSARDTYFRNNVLPTLGAAARQDGSVLGLQADIGNLGDYLATRVSYRLGLRGPGVTAQTACSSGLVVVHLACQSLLTGESDMALAGGVAVNAQHGSGYVHEEGSITSSDGRCRPFDAAAGGTVFGDGGGVVLLKRVADALADGDRIIAVIKGTAINNDGSDKMTYSAPGVDGQARAIARAQRIAGVDPRTIGFVEAHGTGTPLGDPIEIAALTAAFGLGPVERPFCAIGSVKGQIGHLTTAAGTAGLIKALLAVERGLIPAAVHVDEPSPHVPFAGSPFYLPREPRPWDGTRRAGVSSFGVGGTNAHAVIEQAPDRAGHLAPGAADAGGTAGSVPRDELYVLSARTITALDAQRTRLSAHLHTHDGLTPAAVAHTLARGRAAFPYRMAVAAGSTGEAAARLAAAPLPESPATGTGLPVVFAFPGQGAQYEGMGRALYKGDVTFRTEVDRCAEIIRSLTGQDVREVMFGPVAGRAAGAGPGAPWKTRWAQLALFTMEYSVARAVLAAGVAPAAMLGHSVGEYAAACVAGVFPLADALRIVEARGRLMGSTPPGAMTAVCVGEAELRELLPPELDIAAFNAPDRCAVSGAPDAVGRFEDALTVAGVAHTRLRTSHAFHSRSMDAVLDEFREVVAGTRRERPTRRMAATATGTWADPDQLTDPEYWVRQTRDPVRFMDALATVVRDLGPVVLLEAGPGRGLTAMARRTLRQGTAPGGTARWQGTARNGGTAAPGDGTAALPALAPWSPTVDAASALDVVGGLWTRGGHVDWDRCFAGRSPRRVPLPGYPFERATYWIDPPEPPPHAPLATGRPLAEGAVRDRSAIGGTATGGAAAGGTVVGGTAADRAITGGTATGRAATDRAATNGTATGGAVTDRALTCGAVTGGGAPQAPDREARGWLQTPRWSPAPLPEEPARRRARRVLALVPADGLGIGEALTARGHETVAVPWSVPTGTGPSTGGAPASAPAAPAAAAVPTRIGPGDADGLDRLLERVRDEPPFDSVVCAWGLAPADPDATLGERADAVVESFLPLLRIVAAVAQRERSAPLDVLLVTRGRHHTDPADGTEQRPELALLDGAAKVIPHEYPHVRLAEVDLDPVADPGARIAAELDGLVPNSVIAHRDGTRYALGHEPVPAPLPAPTATPTAAPVPVPVPGEAEPLWTDGGTYLITGGLGGIGLALAEDAARTAGDVRLVLTHRAPLPPRHLWRDRAADPSTPPGLRARLAALGRIAASGASVVCVRADVCDEEAMGRVRAEHGPFDGVAHCAGVPGGRLIEAMDDGHLRRVLAPKLRGTLVLDGAVADDATRWLILCSSMVAVFGGLGQADYTGASAFLDAFARARTARGRRTLSLNFDAWSEAGMAVDAARAAGGGPEVYGQHLPVDDPVFTTESVHASSVEYRGTLGRDENTAWLVRDHRAGADGLLPGSAAVEFLRAAGARRLGTERLEILGLDILAPLTVPMGTAAEFAVRLEETAPPSGQPAAAEPVPELEAALRARATSDGPWTTYAQARVRPLPAKAPVPSAPRPEHTDSTDHTDHPGSTDDTGSTGRVGASLRSGVLVFGPRWQNIRRVSRTGPREALITCELDAPFTPDTERFALHPALLDNAAGEPFWDGEHDDHLPVSYERIAVYGRLGPRVHGRVRGHEDPDPDAPAVRIDSLITDDEGRALVAISGYTLRRETSGRRRADRGGTGPDAHPTGARPNVRLVSTEPADLDSLRFVPGPRVAPGPGDVEVEVRATGLNFKEVLTATGMLDADTPDHAYGLEAAGTVTAVGAEVCGVSVGDRVMVMGAECFSRYVTVPARLAHPVPDGMAFAEAASLPVAYATAYDCLVRRARLRRGERVLIHAATGGVGLAAVQVAQRLGAEIHATAGSPEKRAYLTGLGIAKVMDSRTLDFQRETVEAGGVDVVLNSLAGDRITAGLRTLRPNGRFVEIGKRDVASGTALDLRLLEQGATFSVYYPDVYGTDFAECWAEVSALLRTGALPALPVRAFPETEVTEAFRYMSRARHIGKIVVTRPGADGTAAGRPGGGGLIPLGDGITNAIGVRAVHDAFALARPQVLVSRRGAAAREDDFLVAEQILDRRPSASAQHRPPLPYDCVTPNGATEEALAAIWSDLLGLDRVGREDRFPDLGGDSLAATQIVAAVRKRYGVRVSPADILDGRPLHALAAFIDTHRTTG